MKKIIIIVCCILLMLSLVACGGDYPDLSEDSNISGGVGGDSDNNEEDKPTQEEDMLISISDGKYVVVFELNDSSASKSLYEQLPFSITVSNYASNEKIFYPPNKLDTSKVTGAHGPAGSLAYFSPWGNIVMYYGSFGAYNGLYSLGIATKGANNIKNLSGTICVDKA